MLKHIVFMKFKEGITEADIAALEKGLSGLPAQISEIKGYEYGRDVLHSERSCDFALYSTFGDLDAMKRYAVHPAHLAVVEIVKRICERTIVVDYNA